MKKPLIITSDEGADIYGALMLVASKISEDGNPSESRDATIERLVTLAKRIKAEYHSNSDNDNATIQ